MSRNSPIYRFKNFGENFDSGLMFEKSLLRPCTGVTRAQEAASPTVLCVQGQVGAACAYYYNLAISYVHHLFLIFNNAIS